MSKEESGVKIMPGWTKRSIAIAAACYLFLIIWTYIIVNMNNLNVYAAGFWWGNWFAHLQRYIQEFSWMFIFAMFLAILGFSKKFRLTRHELLCVCSTVAIFGVMFMPGSITMITYQSHYGMAGWGEPWVTYYTAANPIPDAHPLYGPLGPAAEGWWKGGSVPWSDPAIYMPVLWRLLLFVSYFGFMMLLGALLKRLWIDVEEIPYPLAAVTLRMIDMCTWKDNKRPEIFSNKWFFLGLILGFFVSSGFIQSMSRLGVPFFKGLRWEMGGPTDLTVLGLLPWFCFHVDLRWWWLASGYVMPTSILISTIVAVWVMHAIIPSIAVAIGAWPPMPKGTSAFTAYWSLNLGTLEPLTPYWGYQNFTYGAYLAIVIFPVIMYRREIIDLFKGLVGAETRVGDQPLSLRLTWILTIIFGICFLAGFYVLGVDLAFGFILVIIYVTLFALGSARIYGLTGGTFGCVANRGGMLLWLMASIGMGIGSWSPIQGGQVAEQGKSGYLASLQTLQTIAVNDGYQSNNPMPHIMQKMYVAKAQRTRSRDVFLAFFIPAMVSIALIPVVELWWVYEWTGGIDTARYGYARWMDKWWGAVLTIRCYSAMMGEGEQKMTNPGAFITMFLLGFFVVLLLYGIKIKFPRLTLLEPAAVILPQLTGTWMWPAWTIALVAKWITIKFGGVEWYQKNGLAWAIGVFAGTAIVALLLYSTINWAIIWRLYTPPA